jgi:crotonobetainyl-CoA:carnitine CoA-transferase CaiB-like acyl-CoA transferase
MAVVEIAADPAARYCGRLFAQLGARVIRVSPGPARTPASPGLAAFELWLDAGKEGAADLDEALARLGATPAAVIAGQSPEDVAAVDSLVSERGLDTLRLGMTWFGEAGPYAGWIGDDALIQALTGLANGFGPVEGPATIPQGCAPQIIAGATLFLAGLAALWGARGGRATARVDVDVLDATLCFTELAPAGFELSGGKAVRSGINRSAANHPTSAYRTSDGWIGVIALTPAQWRGLCDLVGLPQWADDPRFRSSRDRVVHADVIDEALGRIFPTRPTDYWLIAGQRLRIPLAPIPRHVELLETPHWTERGSFASLPGAVDVRAPGLPFRMAFDGGVRAVPRSVAASPLAGLRVIDFSMGWAGPLCTRHLADLGGDVVKIESVTHYDWWRGWEPPGAADPPEYELKPVFNVMNRGKRGITLDLTTEAGRTHALALVAEADVVVENFAPGVMDKLGLGREALQGVRPGLVMVSMGAFGATGPWSFFRAYGSTVEQASGMPHANGHASWPPCLQHGAYGDPVAGVYGAVAALAALHGRDRLGGAWVDLAQVECLFQLGAEQIVSAQRDGDPPRIGSRSPSAAPRCVVAMPGDDEAVAVVVATTAQWQVLCVVLGRADWAADEQLATVEGRNSRGDEIETALAAWARGAGSATRAAMVLQAAGVPAAPVVASHDLASEPHLVASGAWARLDRRHVGLHTMAAPPYRFDGQRPRLGRPAPLLGEHTGEVLKSIGVAEIGPA